MEKGLEKFGGLRKRGGLGGQAEAYTQEAEMLRGDTPCTPTRGVG